jgi:FkbM family methyltransferase
LKYQLRQIISRPALQPVWLRLLKLCHAGLNYGGGQTVESSGEIGALDFAVRSIDHPEVLTLFDVGANDGEYLQAALKVLGSEVKVFSFEPQSSSCEILRSRFSRNERVQICDAALGSEAGSAELYFSSDRESTASLHEVRTLNSLRSETVRVTTIDRFCTDKGIGHIDILKIDTEGHEMDVLLGAAEMLGSDRISAIQFEFGETFLPTKYHFVDIFAFLSPRYRIFRILRRGLVEVVTYSHDLEIYKLANFMCIRKR